jgi:hypothetical protein
MNEKKALIKWFNNYEWDVFGTLTFKYSLNEFDAEKVLKLYWNKIDKYYYGNKSHRNNLRVSKVCCLQKGTNNNNVHFHFLAKKPANIKREKFKYALNDFWHNNIREAGKEVKFRDVDIIKKDINYLMHEFYKLGTDTFIPSASNF